MSLNLIINGTVDPGDHVVTTMMEHNSVIRPVNHKVKDGAEATYVAPDGEGYVDPEEIRKAIKPNTKLVVVNHASNVTGVVQDLAAIGAACQEEGVPFAVDTAQSAGVLPIDMAAWNISFVAFTGHKGLFGPTGTGGVCVADDAEITGTIYGGTGVRSAHPVPPGGVPVPPGGRDAQPGAESPACPPASTGSSSRGPRPSTAARWPCWRNYRMACPKSRASSSGERRVWSAGWRRCR